MSTTFNIRKGNVIPAPASSTDGKWTYTIEINGKHYTTTRTFECQTKARREMQYTVEGMRQWHELREELDKEMGSTDWRY